MPWLDELNWMLQLKEADAEMAALQAKIGDGPLPQSKIHITQRVSNVSI